MMLIHKKNDDTFNMEVKILKACAPSFKKCNKDSDCACYILKCNGLRIAFMHKFEVVILKGVKCNGRSMVKTAEEAIAEYKANH